MVLDLLVLGWTTKYSRVERESLRKSGKVVEKEEKKKSSKKSWDAGIVQK